MLSKYIEFVLNTDQDDNMAAHAAVRQCDVINPITVNPTVLCNLVPRVLSLLRESTLVTAGHVSKLHRGWVLNLILSTLLSREVNVALLYGRYFEKEPSYLSEILPGKLLRLYLNFYEYEMLIERELCLYFTAFLNNCQQPASE